MLLKKTTGFISVIFNFSLLQPALSTPPQSPHTEDPLNHTDSHSGTCLEQEFRSELINICSYNHFLISLSKIKRSYRYILFPHHILPCERELLTADVSLFSKEIDNHSRFNACKLSLFGFLVRKADELRKKEHFNTFNMLNELFLKKRFTILLPSETSPSRVTRYHPSQIYIENDRFYPDLYQIKQAICQDMSLEQSTIKTLDDLITEIINFNLNSISIPLK